jgi:hypothetical protein
MEETKKTTPKRAVLVSIVKEGDGYRVSLDDAIREAGAGRIWRQAEHVTNKLSPASEVENMQFAESELTNFGYYIFARLHAFVERGEN